MNCETKNNATFIQINHSNLIIWI